jgi:hypothetical protein
VEVLTKKTLRAARLGEAKIVTLRFRAGFRSEVTQEIDPNLALA